jgi:ABC-type multidrug transport system fused ATPase/permease subunit
MRTTKTAERFYRNCERMTDMAPDRLGLAIIVLGLMSATIFGLAVTISFELAMILLGATLVLSLALIWLGTRNQSR